MRASFPFLWILPLWGAIAGIYFAVAYVYLWRKARVNMWKVWCKVSGDNLRAEWRFAEEVRRFPKLNVGYQLVKWCTPAVCLGYLALVFIYLLRR